MQWYVKGGWVCVHVRVQNMGLIILHTCIIVFILVFVIECDLAGKGSKILNKIRASSLIY